MTDYWTKVDAASIPLPSEGESQLCEDLRCQQHQLDHLTQAVTELMTYLRVQPSAALLPQEVQPMVPLRPTILHHASLPDCYSGEPTGCRNFILTCKLYLAEFPEMTDQQCITVLIQRLMGRAQEWAASVWRASGRLAADFPAFLQQFPGHV